jgi:hypothetical protein
MYAIKENKIQWGRFFHNGVEGILCMLRWICLDYAFPLLLFTAKGKHLESGLQAKVKFDISQFF